MKKYDVLIVGGSSTGCWFAEKMAEKGSKVLSTCDAKYLEVGISSKSDNADLIMVFYCEK